ncbi:hypothetical protein EDD16DRAFT_1525802 [Pisolithus croceorrhizus]|nr:hypothetical protein EDD16DRAFT_1525802 [Pisolithus croceorrhizus]
MASSVGSRGSLYKGVKGVGRLDMEWGIPEGSREHLEGGRGSRVTLWVKRHWRRRSREGRSRRRHRQFKRVMSRVMVYSLRGNVSLLSENTLVFNLPKKGNAPKRSFGDEHLISRQGWRSTGGRRKLKSWEKGLELSAGEVRLDTVKAGRWESSGRASGDPGTCCAGEPKQGCNQYCWSDAAGWGAKRGTELVATPTNCLGSLSKIPGKIWGIGQIKPGFVVPACPELGYCARACKSRGWVTHGPWGGRSPGLIGVHHPNQPQLMRCALGQVRVVVQDTGYSGF